MGALNAGIPLSINNAQPIQGPLDNYEKGLSVQSLINQSALQKQALQTQQVQEQQQQIALEQQKQQFQDSQTLRSLAPQFVKKDASGKSIGFDYSGLLDKAGGSGVSPVMVAQLRNQYAESVKNMAGADESVRNNEIAKNKLMYEGIEGLKGVDDPAQRFTAYQQILNKLKMGGIDTSTLNPNKPPSNDELTGFETQLGMHGQVLADAKTAAETKESEAKASSEQATAGLTNLKLNIAKNTKPGDYDSTIDQIAGRTNPALAARTKSMVNFSLSRGDFEGAQKALNAANEQVGAIEKETNPALLQFKAREAANSAAIQQAIKNGSAEDAGRMLAEHLVAPSEIAARSNPSFLVKANEAALKHDSTYNAQKADADFNVAKSPQNSAFFGSANSLTNKGGTLDQLEAQYKKLPGQRKIPAFNSLQDYLSYHSGDPAVAGFMQTALAAADDYAKVVGGGVGSDTSRLQFMQSFSHAHSEAGFKASVDAARAGVGSQQDARIGDNPILKNMYGGGTAAQRTATKTAPAKPEGATHYGIGSADKKKHYLDVNGKDLGLAE
jgi:hypothetical protein